VRDIEATVLTPAKEATFNRVSNANSLFYSFRKATVDPNNSREDEIRSDAQPTIWGELEFPTAPPSVPVTHQNGFLYRQRACVAGPDRTNMFQWSLPIAEQGWLLCNTLPGVWNARQLIGVIGFDLVGARAINTRPDAALVVGAFGAGLEYFDGDRNRFKLLSTEIARRAHTSAFDLSRDRAIIFGGEALDGTLLGDTWELKPGQAPEKKTPPGLTPSPRKHAAMAYHPSLGVVVLHGGNDGTKTLDDTWARDGQSWTPLKHRPERGSRTTRAQLLRRPRIGHE
jgi:hypothetical protein